MSNRLNFGVPMGMGMAGTGVAAKGAPPAGQGVVDPKQATGIFAASTQKSTSTTQPPAWMQPYMADYLGKVQGVVNQPYKPSPSQFAGPNNTLQNAWQAITNRAVGGSPVMNAGNKQLTDTINGNYLKGNPQLNNQIQAAQGDLTRSWNNVQKPAWEKAMQGSGSFGNTGVMEAYGDATNDLQRNLGRISSDMRFNNYNTERGYQMNATSMAPTFANNDYVDANALLQVGNQQQGFNDRGAGENYRWWEEAQNFPRQNLELYGNAINRVNGGSTTTTQQPGPSPAGQFAGGAVTGMTLWDMGKKAGWW